MMPLADAPTTTEVPDVSPFIAAMKMAGWPSPVIEIIPLCSDKPEPFLTRLHWELKNTVVQHISNKGWDSFTTPLTSGFFYPPGSVSLGDLMLMVLRGARTDATR